MAGPGQWFPNGGSGGAGGSGDVVGPAVAIDNAAARYDSTTGKLIQGSALIIGDVAAGVLPISAEDGVTTNIGISITPKGTGAIGIPVGSVAAPGVGFNGSPTTGLALVNGAFIVVDGGTLQAVFDDFEPGLKLPNTGGVMWGSNTSPHLSVSDTGEKRDSAAVLRDTSGFDGGLGKRLTGRVIEASTAGSGSPNLLAATESRKVLTNEGATAEAYNTLPTAVAGIEFVFYCQDIDGIRVVAAAGDTIRLGSTVSAAAGFVRSSTVGSALILVAINATEWVAISVVGTWTVDS
jgi:hypothetical protein